MLIETQYLVYGAIFLCALLLIEGIYFLVSDSVGGRITVNRRMSLLESGHSTREVYEQLLRRQPKRIDALGIAGDAFKSFDSLIMQAGLSISAGKMMALIAGLFGLVFIGVMVGARSTFIPSIMPLPLAALLAALMIGIGLPILYLVRKKDARLKKFSEQLPDALNVMVRSLQAGHPVSAAMNLVTKEMADPIGTEFGIAVDEMTYGLDLRDALANLGERVKVNDFQYVVVSISIQHDTGGNLAEVLAGLSRVIRDRFKLFRKIKALSGEGRMSAMVLSLLPFITVTVIFTLSPTFYLDVIEDPMFLPIAGGAFLLMLTGIFIMYRMVNFRV